MNSKLEAMLRRLKPEKRLHALKHRAVEELPFIGTVSKSPSRVLYDTTVYIDVLQARFPQEAELAIRATDAWHSTVTAAELATPCGFLDPQHPETSQAVRQIAAILERRPSHRTIAPDQEIWLDAGVLSGMLARLQGYSSQERRRTLNDALLLASARKYGLAVLTRNIRDFDLLQQLEPTAQVLFYNRL